MKKRLAFIIGVTFLVMIGLVSGMKLKRVEAEESEKTKTVKLSELVDLEEPYIDYEDDLLIIDVDLDVPETSQYYFEIYANKVEMTSSFYKELPDCKITINADIDHKKIVNSIKDILYYLVSSSLFDNDNIIVYLLTPSESIFNYIKNLVNPNNFNNHLQNITFKFATVRTNRKILVG